MPGRFHIVDADQHVNPPPTFWEQYLPAHLRALAPKLEAGEDADYVVFEGSRKKFNLIGATAGRDPKDFKMNGRLSDSRIGGWMPDARLDDMDKDGVDVAILFGGGPLGTNNDELFMASFSAYNRWLADFCSHAPDRLSGIAYVPMRDVQQTIALMKEAAELGFTGVNIPAFPQANEKLPAGLAGAGQLLALTGDPTGLRRYDQPEFDPLWAAAIDLDLTLTVHLGARSPRYMEMDKFLPDLPMSKLAMAEPIVIMIFGGVFQRHPKLRFATMESGVGWFAWLCNYMDATWRNQRYWTNSPLKEEPSVFMDRNVYGSFIDEMIGIRNIDVFGCKNIMWTSDYPHSETTFPKSHQVIERIFSEAGASDQVREQVLGAVARKLFRTGAGRARPVKAIAAE